MIGDKIVTLELPRPICLPIGSTVRLVIETIQRHHTGAVLVCQGHRPVGIMTERDVLMKVVRRDVNYDEPIDKFMTPAPRTLTSDHTIGEAISLMTSEGFRNIPIVDKTTGEATALFRVTDIIHHLAESFPEHVLNLPPISDQQMRTPDGA